MLNLGYNSAESLSHCLFADPGGMGAVYRAWGPYPQCPDCPQRNDSPAGDEIRLLWPNCASNSIGRPRSWLG